MQQSTSALFESKAINEYQQLIQKEASRLYYHYFDLAERFGLEYDDFWQEAACSFVQVLRMLEITELPIPPIAHGYFRRKTLENTYLHLIRNSSGVHTQKPSKRSPKAPTIHLMSLEHLLQDSDARKELEKVENDPAFDAMEAIDAIRSLSDQHLMLALLLVNGASQRELVRKGVLPRRTLDRLISEMRQALA